MESRLFSPDANELEWLTFSADGFKEPVCGIIYRAGESSCGVPLGGIGTGCIDLDTDGTFGRCSIFNSFTPPRVLDMPFLALALDGKTIVLCCREQKNAEAAKAIRYWGHYPAADLEYELDVPISIGLRAWSPFVPGDSALSNTPGIVFEVRLRSLASAELSGKIAFTFPGPTDEESEASRYTRRALCGELDGVEVTTDGGVGFALGAIGDRVRTGGSLTREDGTWESITSELPLPAAEHAGASACVDFTLGAGEERIVRFVLAWYHPRWIACEWRHYLHAYSARFGGAAEVGQFLAREHGSILRRILNWQQAIFSAQEYPVWLREQLVNILHTITEDAFWARDSIPSADWCKPDGIFGLAESPRSVPHVAIPSDWYGCLPFVFFFPDLFSSLLRAYAHYQLPNGEIPLGLGWYVDLGSPIYDFLRTTNSPNFVDLVDRLWQRDNDRRILDEFYPAVKKAIQFTQTLDRDCDGLPDLDPWPTGNQFYGAWHWVGTAVHPNGYWLAALAMAERMAEAVGDIAFAHDCRIWFDRGCQSLEEKLWNGGYYLLYKDSASGEQSDTILSNQLAGQWLANLHGLRPVFAPDRTAEVLETVRQRIVPLSDYGVRNAVRPDGSIDEGGGIQSTGIFTGETICLACTFAYNGDAETAEQAAHKLMRNIVLRQGLEWDMPNNINPETGKVNFGTDFYQMMILWALPLALSGQDISSACASGGFIDRVLQAGRG